MGVSSTTTSSASNGGGGSMCNPGTITDCYDGPEATSDIGLCKVGKKTCNNDGSGNSACKGEVVPTAETCSNTADEDCDGHDCVISSKSFGDASDQSVSTIAIDAFDNVLIAGKFGGALDFGNGPMISDTASDIFVAKSDTNGKPTWSIHFSSSGPSAVDGLATDATGNCAVTGYFSGNMTIAGAQFSTAAGDYDIYVAKFDPSGSLLWAHQLGSKQPDRATSIVATSTSDFVLTGYFEDTADFGAGTLVNSAPGMGDVLLLKLDGTDGHTVWSKGFGNSSIEEGKDVAVDTNDNVILVGHYFSMPLNLGGSDLPPIGAGKEATFYAKFDKNGNHLWSYQLGAASPGSVKVNHSDEILLTAIFYAPLNVGIKTVSNNGGADLLMIKIGSGGSPIWAYGFGGAGNDSGSLALDAAGNIILAMAFEQEMVLGVDKLVSAGGIDIALAKLNTSGNVVWTRRYGGVADEVAIPAAFQASGEGLLAGGMDESVDFGAGPLSFKGGHDVFLARFAP